MLGSDLCDFSDAYIVVKENITVTKKTFTADDIYCWWYWLHLLHLITQQLTLMLLILQIIMLFVIKNWFLKIINKNKNKSLSIVFQKLMV